MSTLNKTMPKARMVNYRADQVDVNYRAGMVDAIAWYTRMREGEVTAADVQDVIDVDLADCSPIFRRGWKNTWKALDAALTEEVDRNGN